MTTPSSTAGELTIQELCRICAVQTEFVTALVQEGAITPAAGSAPESWRFASLHVHHAQVASRLYRDLGVNPAGAALALQLLDELETLRAQLAGGLAASAVDAA
jgi:chaperone modulatory protein CbpM